MKPVPWVCIASTVVILVAALVIGLVLGLEARSIQPVNVHTIYIPWQRRCHAKTATDCMLPDKLAFDTTYVDKLRQKLKHAKVTLWTYDKLRDASEEISPGLWDTLWKRVKHPVMIVDFYRWFVLYHYGGVYVQYGSELNKKDARSYLPRTGNTLLFVEKVLTPEQCVKYGKRRIRNWQPEESVRVGTATMSTRMKRDPFIKFVLEQLYLKITTLDVNEDYDILYISGNAGVTEAYHKYPKRHMLELVPEKQRDKLVKWSTSASWRTDAQTKTT